LTVIILVLIPALGHAPESAGTAHAVAAAADAASQSANDPSWVVSLLLALGKLVLMVGVLYYVGSKVVPWLLEKVARLRSRELFTLTVLVLSIAVAIGAYELFGASVALGAFLAGMVVAQSPVSQQAGIDALPMRDAFAVLFFVAVGMLFDPSFVQDEKKLLVVLAGMGIVFIAKPLAAFMIVGVLGYPFRTALTVAIALAQIGEFSFIVGDLATTHGLLPEEGRTALTACALASSTVNPILFRTIDPIESWARKRPRLWKALNGRAARRAEKMNEDAVERISTGSNRLAIVVGYGPVGRQVDRLLRDAGMDTVVIDLNMDTITQLKSEGRTAIYGDAVQETLLEEAGVARASHLALSTPPGANQQVLIAAARKLNPPIRLLARARYVREGTALRGQGADNIVVDEVESAVALTQLVLAETQAESA